MAEPLVFTDTLAHWKLLTRPRASDLADTRNQLHWAAQIVSALGVSLAEPREDYAHTSLEWSVPRQGLLSQVSASSPALRALLCFPDLSIELLREQADGTHETLASISLDGQTVAEVHGALEAAVSEALGRPQTLTRSSHDLPAHRVDPAGEGAAFGGWKEHALAELTRWYENGARALTELRGQDPRASAVRCWPHHFDIATLLELEHERPGDPSSPVTRSVGVGMTPGDASYADAYWYVNFWPAPEPAAELPALAGGGIWHREGWVGAVLTSTALRDPQAENFAAFMRAGIAACEALSRSDRSTP